jgi:GDP-mannose 6-dehydrogenase
MRLFCADTRLNVSPAYLRPGFAFGGSCLPKDLRALVYKAKDMDVEVPVLSALLESNRKHVAKAASMVLQTGARRVGILGLSFKEGTDDLRESPMVSLIEILIGKGLELAIYDKDVSRANLVGANREYIEREIPHIWSLVRGSVDEVLAAAQVVVVGKATAEFSGIGERLGPEQRVIDLVRALRERVSDGRAYDGICW